MELAKKQTWGRKTVIGIIEKEKDTGFNVHYGKNVEVIWLEVKLTVFLTILIKAYDTYSSSKERE